MGNMMYKVGDIVRVREDLKPHEIYGEYCATEGMLRFAGRDVTIKSVENDSYRIEEMGLYWTDGMFEEKIKPAEIDDDSRVDDNVSSVELSSKNLFDLYK